MQEQRAMHRREEQERQAVVEEERKLLQRLRQLQRNRLANEQARCPTPPSSSPAKRARVLPQEKNPHPASSPVTTDKKRSSATVSGPQLSSVSETSVQQQPGDREGQAEGTAQAVSMFTGSSLSQNTGRGVRTVFASCLNPKTTDKSVETFFENKHRSGGGPIQNLLRLNETSALLHFKNYQDADSVVKKGQHTLDRSKVQVSRVNLEQFCDRDVAVASSDKAIPETKTLASQSEGTFTKKKSPSGKAQKSVQCMEFAKSGSSEEGKISTAKKSVPRGQAQKLAKSTDCAKSGSEEEGKISTAKKSVPSSQAQKSGKCTECAGLGSEEEVKVSMAIESNPKCLSPESSSQSPATAPYCKETPIKLGSEVINTITEDPQWLKKLVAILRPEAAKFKWKRPDHIIIMCLADEPPEDWVQRVTTVVNNFVHSVVEVGK